MNDLKIGFKKWLQENFSKSTAYGSFSLVQKIFDKNFENSENWQEQSESIMPLLARYFEFANREYYLDRVTVWYALDYFDELTEFIYAKKLSTHELPVSLYLYDGKKDYFICKVPLYRLSDHLKYLSAMVYEYNISSNLDDREPFDILLPLPEIYDNIKPLDVKDTAIHIVYENTNNSAEKAALTKYCDFLYLTTKNPTFDYKNNPTVNMATKKNPKIKVHNYKEIAPITGMTPRKIMPDKKKKRETPIGFVYSTEDIASIFDIDFNTAINLMDRYGKKYKITTVIDSYYSVVKTDECLQECHHFKDKQKNEKYSDVDYMVEGYEQWYTREDALEALGIKKAAFYSHIAKKCLYIDYAKGAPKYYFPELEHFKKMPEIKRISLRKK